MDRSEFHLRIVDHCCKKLYLLIWLFECEPLKAIEKNFQLFCFLYTKKKSNSKKIQEINLKLNAYNIKIEYL